LDAVLSQVQSIQLALHWTPGDGTQLVLGRVQEPEGAHASEVGQFSDGVLADVTHFEHTEVSYAPRQFDQAVSG
jgi:hypothetical protein